MRRLIAVAILAVLILVFGFISDCYVNGTCRSFLSKTDALIKTFDAGEKSTCVKNADKIKSDFNEKREKLAFFVNHAFIDDLSKLYAELPVYANNNAKSDFYATAEKIRLNLNSIMEEEGLHADSFY